MKGCCFTIADFSKKELQYVESREASLLNGTKIAIKHRHLNTMNQRLQTINQQGERKVFT